MLRNDTDLSHCQHLAQSCNWGTAPFKRSKSSSVSMCFRTEIGTSGERKAATAILCRLHLLCWTKAAACNWLMLRLCCEVVRNMNSKKNFCLSLVEWKCQWPKNNNTKVHFHSGPSGGAPPSGRSHTATARRHFGQKTTANVAPYCKFSSPMAWSLHQPGSHSSFSCLLMLQHTIPCEAWTWWGWYPWQKTIISAI